MHADGLLPPRAIGIPKAPSPYERIAPRYDTLHRRWLRGAGAPAQAALEGAVRALIHPGSSILDVGCGTGHFARRLIAEGLAPEQITLVDASARMLKATADLPLHRHTAQIEALPFPDGHFDLITCAWVIETTRHPGTAICEMCRVLRPGGSVCVIFCATEPALSLTGWLLRKSVQRRGTGRFLNRRDIASAFAAQERFDLRWLPCPGPTAALLARSLR